MDKFIIKIRDFNAPLSIISSQNISKDIKYLHVSDPFDFINNTESILT